MDIEKIEQEKKKLLDPRPNMIATYETEVTPDFLAKCIFAFFTRRKIKIHSPLQIKVQEDGQEKTT